MQRLTFTFIPDALEAMDRLQKRTGLKKADVVNRSLQVFDVLDAEARAGKQIIVRAADGTEERIRFL